MKIEQTKIELGESPEKIEELKIMKNRINNSLENKETLEKVSSDFIYTFQQLGLSFQEATDLCNNVFVLLKSQIPLIDIEQKILNIFQNVKYNKEQNLIDILHEKLKDRASIITSQVAPEFKDIKGKTIDYGAGDGQVTQLLHDKLGLDIEGVDVRMYKASNISIPVMLFNGGHVEVPNETYEAGLLTNVLHHEKNNEKIIDELDRIVKNKLVVLETVPIGETEEEMEIDKNRTFMNDYLYNRLFHSADVPVPGSFETPKKWVERFAKHGWKLINEKDLGFDQPTIKDRHYLLVFGR